MRKAGKTVTSAISMIFVLDKNGLPGLGWEVVEMEGIVAPRIDVLVEDADLVTAEFEMCEADAMWIKKDSESDDGPSVAIKVIVTSLTWGVLGTLPWNVRFCGENSNHVEALPKSADSCTRGLLIRLVLIVYEKSFPAVASTSGRTPVNRETESDVAISTTTISSVSLYWSRIVIVTLVVVASVGGMPLMEIVPASRCTHPGPFDVTETISEFFTSWPSSVRLFRNLVEEKASPCEMLIVWWSSVDVRTW
jgi:hypothetical protein